MNTNIYQRIVREVNGGGRKHERDCFADISNKIGCYDKTRKKKVNSFVTLDYE